MSYSQNSEQEHILDVVGKETGTFMDLGAFDGKTFSNTLALAELGWSGVLVEPSAFAFKNLLEIHGSNGNLQLVQALVGIERGLMPFWNSEDAVSTTEARSFATWKAIGKFKPICYVPQITVKELIEWFPILGNSKVVSIDTEGTSADLFLHWPIEMCAPKVFCVEYDKKRNEVNARAMEWGYQLAYENSENLVLVR